MIEMMRWDKALWFLSGSIVLAAVIFLASSRDTSANPPGQCGWCGRSCLSFSCEGITSLPEETCTGENDRSCGTEKQTCLSTPNFIVPKPGYYFHCKEKCKRLEPDPKNCASNPYEHYYTSAWYKEFTAGTVGLGLIGYEFSCKMDPKFLGMPGTVEEIDCSPKVEGGSFTAMIQARVRMVVFLQGEVSDPPAGEWVTWTRTRRIRNGQGAWDGAGEDPESIPLAVSWPVIDCKVLNNHKVTVEVIVRVYFGQRCHALNSIPGGEAKAADPIFQCLAGF